MKKIINVCSLGIILAILTGIFVFPVGADAAVDSWEGGAVGGFDCDAFVDTEEKHTGNASLKVVSRQSVTANVYWQFRQYISVKQNTTYRVGAWVKAEKANSANIIVSWGTRLPLCELGGTYDWKYFEYNWYSGDTTTAELQLTVEGIAKGIWFDDVVFYELDSSNAPVGENLVSNPGFENGVSVENNNDPPQTNIDYGFGIEEKRDELMAQEFIDWSDFSQTTGLERAIPMVKKSGFNIDGNLDDWEEMYEINIPATNDQVIAFGEYNGLDDLSAVMKFAYDDENLYFSAAVKDDVHVSRADSEYWTGDSIQLAIGEDRVTYGYEYGITYMPDEDKAYVFSPQVAQSALDKITAAGRIEGNMTYYEAAIPWETNILQTPKDKFLASAIVNDNDGNGRKSCIQITEGIATGKLNDEFCVMNFMEGDYDFQYWISGDFKVSESSENTYTFFCLNRGGDREFILNIPTYAEPVRVTIPKDKLVHYEFEASFTGSETHYLDASVETDGQRSALRNEVTIEKMPRTDEEFTAELAKIRDEYLPELKWLTGLCEQQGIPTDYEDVNTTVIEMFIPYAREDRDMGLSERSDYVLDCLNGLYAEARDNMNGYLSGEKEYKVTYKYVTSKIDTDGEMVYADMKNTQTGEITRRPMIGTGYGNFWQYISKDLPIFSDIGASVAQIEIGPDSFLVAPGTITNWSKIGGYPATFEIVKDEKYSGEASLHIISTQESQPGNWVYYSQRYSVKPNTTYTYGLAAKANNPEGGGGVWFSVNAWAGTRQTITGTHDWQTYEYQYTTGPEETELEFYILCENVNECWIDDVFVRELGSDENLLQNSGFEFGAGFENRDGILINPSGADDIIATLQSAEDNNVTVSLLISPHYMPGFILDESEENKSRGTHFINFNVESARIRQALDIYLSELLPKIKDYKSLNSICLLNEPLIWSSEDEFFIQGFREYLKEIYGDIAELNKNYGSDFASFDEITFEYVKGTNQLWNNFSADLSKAGKTPVYYDYQKFNNEVIAEFYGFLRDTAKKYAPDLPVSFKSLNQTFDYDSDYIRTIWRGGGDLNLIKDITDYNGCDAHAYVDAADGNHIMTKERWYDYLTSVKDAPVFNMEDHIIRDGNTDYIPEQELWWTSNAWQMALHGGTMNASWVWARTFNTADALYGSVLERPDVIAGYGKTALDMNRLAYEIEAIVKKTADVAVLDSIPSRAASNAFQSAQNNAWKGSVLSGQETDHITEAQIEEGKLSEYKLLIVPCAARVLESTLDAINTFLDNGGKVIIVGEESLKLDEYGHEHDAAKLESVFSRCDVYPAVSYNVNVVDPDAAKMRDIIWEALEELGLNKVEIVDSNTGELVSNVEWNYAMCDGKLIVSLINYDWGTEKDISVIVNGEKIETFRELREDKEYNASYTLSYYKPVMFSIDASI